MNTRCPKPKDNGTSDEWPPFRAHEQGTTSQHFGATTSRQTAFKAFMPTIR